MRVPPLPCIPSQAPPRTSQAAARAQQRLCAALSEFGIGITSVSCICGQAAIAGLRDSVRPTASCDCAMTPIFVMSDNAGGVPVHRQQFM